MSTDYSKMSDFEINCEVAKYNNWTSKSFVHEIHSGKWNPCQNAGDAWHIIIDNKISIVSLDNKWIAAPVDTVIDGITGDSEVCFYASYDAVVDVNPLRAAMIVFLMIQESKNAS